MKTVWQSNQIAEFGPRGVWGLIPSALMIRVCLQKTKDKRQPPGRLYKQRKNLNLTPTN